MKDDVKAFLKTGVAERDIYKDLLRKSRDKNFLWFLEVSVYGVINCSAKWKFKTVQAMCKINLQQMTVILKQCFRIISSRVAIFDAEIVECLLIPGGNAFKSDFL